MTRTADGAGRLRVAPGGSDRSHPWTVTAQAMFSNRDRSDRRHRKPSWRIGRLGQGLAEDRFDLGGREQVEDWFTSVYLLRHEGGAALFDGGFRDGHLERALKDRGILPEDVTDVFLTHSHTDHVAALGLFPQATAWVMPADASLGAGARPPAWPLTVHPTYHSDHSPAPA